MEEVLVRESKYGSLLVDDTNAHVIQAQEIEIAVAATFTLLAEDGYPLTGTESQAQVATITLAGTAGTVRIAGPYGLTHDLEWITSLTATAAAFVTDNAADYAAWGITVTSSSEDIIFTAATAGEPFDFNSFVITNVVTDLTGSAVATTANIASPLTMHGIVGALVPVGTKFWAKTKFTRIQLSVGSVFCK